MAIRFGDAVQAFAQGRQARQQQQQNSIDALIKQAQLKELGYDVQPGQGRFGSPTLVQNPDFNGTKQLQREKLAIENQKLKADLGTYGQAPPPGFMRFGGKLMRDPSYKRSETPEERQAKLEDEIAKSELTSQAKALPKLDQAFQAAKQLEELYGQSLNPVSVAPGDTMGGIANRMAGPARRFGAVVGTNPNLNKYLTNRQGFAGLIAKGGFGEAGMLTNQDIQRITKLLPNEYSTKEEAALGFQEINKILGSARARFDQSKQKYIGGRFGQPEQGGDPLETEAQAAIQAGADPEAVKQRLQKIRAGRG